MIGPSAAELVMEDNGTSTLGQWRRVFEIVVREARPAVENQKRKLPADGVKLAHDTAAPMPDAQHRRRREAPSAACCC